MTVPAQGHQDRAYGRLRRHTPLGETYVLIGCPADCGWGLADPEHWHESSGTADLCVGLLYSAEEGTMVPVVYEVRHQGATPPF